MGGIATNEMTAIGSESAKVEAVEAAPKPTTSKTLAERNGSRGNQRNCGERVA